MTQCAEILHHLDTVGPLTPLDALNLFGCFRLTSRIWDLKQQGHEIYTGTCHLHNGKRVAIYSLIKQAQKELSL
tara:strand:- start:873 stop:1094 length:222 start_codon:yes stop_codon:yes gene_type:complete